MADIRTKNAFFECLDECAKQLEQLNKQYPEFASSVATDGVQEWIRFRNRVVFVDPGVPERVDVQKIAAELIQSNNPEDVLEILSRDHETEITLYDLIDWVGKDAYFAALLDEAKMYQENCISSGQIAELWNDLERPAPGNMRWTEASVDKLFEG